MEFYSELDSTEKDILCSVLTPAEKSEDRGKFENRLPKLSGFWESVKKETAHEIVPVPNRSRNHELRSKKKNKKIRFFNSGQLNLTHPHLHDELQKIFNLLKSHQATHHPNTRISNFTYIKDYFSLV